MALVEWLILAGLDDVNERGNIVWQALENSRHLGMALTEAECRNGLEACLQRGWLRQVDEQLVREIQSLLRADPVVMPVPFDPSTHWGIDFSLEGAQLTRIVSAEILGQDWEDDIRVEDSYFREEHRYCRTEAGVAAVMREYESMESWEKPKSIRTVPIGPWCVYWWRRYPAGYRLELTFGEA